MKRFLHFVVYLVAFMALLPIPEHAPTEVLAVGIPFMAALCVFGESFVKVPMIGFRAGIDMEVWKKYIIEKLRKTNEFIFLSKDDSGFVLGGAVVHIPQAGVAPVVVKNRSAYPATAVRRTDTDITYALDTYSTDPTHIPWADLQTISYDKLDSVLGNHTSELSEIIADDLLIKWGPGAGGNFVRTTGGAAAGTVVGVGGQTGTRLGAHEKDVQKLMIKMNQSNVPKKGRKLMFDDNMYEFFYDSLSASQMNAFNQFADNKEGTVGRLHGFDISTRSSVLAYNSSDVVKALGSAIAATDQYASLAWHPNFVCRAIGEMKPFQDKDNPLYYGDLYSMIARMGGRKERTDGAGIWALVQA